jgi:hypothetical protein
MALAVGVTRRPGRSKSGLPSSCSRSRKATETAGCGADTAGIDHGREGPKVLELHSEILSRGMN